MIKLFLPVDIETGAIDDGFVDGLITYINDQYPEGERQKFAVVPMARIAELEAEVRELNDDNGNGRVAYSMEREENQRLREALGFYADTDRYITHLTIHEPDYGGPCCDVARDKGAKARKALGG